MGECNKEYEKVKEIKMISILGRNMKDFDVLKLLGRLLIQE